MIDEERQREALEARDRMLDLQAAADQAAVAYQHAVRRLRTEGASLREIADALGMSYQRVHQIVDVRSGKGAIRESPDKRVCSFCGASARQIRRLIAGPHVYICNRCIDLANAVRTRGVPVGDEWTRMDPETDPEARCSFCGKARRDTTGMVVVAEAAPPAQRRRGRRSALRRPSGVRECAECLDLCNQVMAEPEH